MKKIVSLLLISILSVCIIANAMASDFDFTNLSFSELLELQQKLNQALWSCDEWIEVEVPMGVWDVGKDIPGGRWQISCGSQYKKTHIALYAERSTDGSPNIWRGSNDIKNGEFMVLDFTDGYVIEITEGTAIFKHYVPSFRFN